MKKASRFSDEETQSRFEALITAAVHTPRIAVVTKTAPEIHTLSTEEMWRRAAEKVTDRKSIPRK